MLVRTRMAPSPTGEYHIGSMRTMLFNYAFAKQNNGKFVLRIEDTDRQRYVEGAVERLLQVVKDYGLNWNEGPEIGGPYGPYIQSENLKKYVDHAYELVSKDKAYYCFCTSERLDSLRKEQQANHAPKTSYDGLCRNISKDEAQKKVAAGEKYVIRLKTPKNEKLVLNDLIHGEVSFDTSEIDDVILLKSDGYPTYHLGVVVDDHFMQITHVLRGIEWMPSTPIHILLYKAFNWEMPLHGHLPNAKEVGATKKMSKRTGSVSCVDFLREGYLPEALLNFLMFIGWNPGTEKEIYTLEEFVNDFSLERVQKTDLVAFDREKLLWYNGYYIRQLSPKDLYEKLKEWAKKYEISLHGEDKDDDFNIKVTGLTQERLKKLSEFNDLVSYFYEEPAITEDLLFKYAGGKPHTKEILGAFDATLSSVSVGDWNRDNLEKVCHELLEKSNYKPKEAFMTLRVALTGRDASPHIFDVLDVLGREKSLVRIKSSA